MMRLTPHRRSPTRVTLAVEGRIAGEYTALLESECAELLAVGGVELDLSYVSHVDVAGVSTLRKLRGRGAVIALCPPFILELVNGKPSV